MQRKIQVVLTLMVGAEPWVGVLAPSGKRFKLPASCEIFEIFKGVSDGWHMQAKRPKHAEPTVRVPLSVWLTTVANGGTSPSS